MADLVNASKYWVPIDISEIIRPFLGSSIVWPNARADVIQKLSSAVNHILCHSVRVIFNRSSDITLQIPYSAITLPTWAFRFNDTGYISKSLKYEIIYHEYVSGGNQASDQGAYFARDAAPEYNELVYLSISDTSKPPIEHNNAIILEWKDDITFGVVTKNLIYETGATDEFLRFHDICVREMPYSRFAEAGAGYSRLIQEGDAKSSQPIKSEQISSIATSMHILREYNMPHVLSWCIDSTAETVPATSYNTTTLTNILDNTSTARTATSPGLIIDAYKAGVGIETTVTLRIYVYASVTNAAGTGTIRFAGPNGNADVTVDSTSRTWYTTTLELNTDIDWDYDTDTDINKVDVFAAIDNASYAVNLHAISGWLEY